MPRIYVGTYNAYNEGSLKGAWLDLEDYDDQDDFLRACRELHADESDPELMFCDHEGIPREFIGECYLKPEFWDYMNCDIDDDVKEAFMYLFDEWNEDRCRDSYFGEFDSRTKMAEHLVDETCLLSEIPENLQCYFDYEAYGRDMELGGDVWEHNCHWFWRNY